MLIENSEYIYKDFYKNMNYFLEQSLFPHDLKQADVAPVYKKKSLLLKVTMGLCTFFLIYPRYMKGASMIKPKPIFIIFYLNTNVDFMKIIIHSTV